MPHLWLKWVFEVIFGIFRSFQVILGQFDTECAISCHFLVKKFIFSIFCIFLACS